MIRKLSIKGVFGLYDYEISFENDSNVKVITGPNGYGKTTLLSAINHLYKGDFWFFYYLIFDEFTICIVNYNNNCQEIHVKKSIVANKQTNGQEETDKPSYEVSVSLQNSDEHICIESVVFNEEYIRDIYSSCLRVCSRDNLDISDEELISSYYHNIEDSYVQRNCKNISLALQERNTVFLPAQRLFQQDLIVYNRPNRTYRSSLNYEIDRVNRDLEILYSRTQKEFAAVSQRIDATFISRLVQYSGGYSMEELKERLDRLRERIDGYKQMNLFINMEVLSCTFDNDEYNNKLKYVLSLYVDDMNSKMTQFEDLYSKLSLFKQLITNKVLSQKRIRISEHGVSLISDNGYAIEDLHKLSSGEQNLIILYYNLIFNCNKNTILLIDEPENSLHVAWQESMLDDFKKISNNTGCQIILATHSPTIINGNWDITTDLFKQYHTK